MTSNVPDLGRQAAYRLTEQDKKDLRVIMADRRETRVSNVLRDLVQQEAAAVRQRWTQAAERRVKESDG